MRQTVAFTCAPRLQRSWLTHNCVLHRETLRVSQALRAQTTNLFIGREDERQRLSEFVDIGTLDRRQRRGDEGLRITSSATVEFPVSLGQGKRFFPIRIIRNGVGVADE